MGNHPRAGGGWARCSLRRRPLDRQKTAPSRRDHGDALSPRDRPPRRPVKSRLPTKVPQRPAGPAAPTPRACAAAHNELTRLSANLQEESPNRGSLLALWAFFAWAICMGDVRSEPICHACTVFRRCASGSNTARDALCGLALTESLVFVLLDLFHLRGIDALEIE